MKILYLGSFKHFYCTEKYVEYALKSFGIQVSRWDGANETNPRKICNFIDEHKPDVVLSSKAKIHGFPDILTHCRNCGILTVCWQWDYYFGYCDKDIPQFYSDILLGTDAGNVQRFRDKGWNYSVLRQGIHTPDAQLFSLPIECQVGFIGSIGGHESRSELLKFLDTTYRSKFRRYGNCRGLALNKQLARIGIVVGDSYPGDHYWSNRIYEILGRGGFLLHPETVGLEEEFEDGKHYVSYPRGDFDKLAYLIKYYLDNPNKRELIKRQGHEYCKTNFTYTHRVLELLRLIRTTLKQREEHASIS